MAQELEIDSEKMALQDEIIKLNIELSAAKAEAEKQKKNAEMWLQDSTHQCVKFNKALNFLHAVELMINQIGINSAALELIKQTINSYIKEAQNEL